MTSTARLMSVFLLTALVPATAWAQVAGPATDLTIEVEGDLLRHGGVVTIQHLPVPAAEWPANLAQSPVATVRLSARYAEIQVRHPAEGTFRYRFRTAGANANAGATPDRLVTQVLSIIGASTDNSGPLLKQGFVGASPSGGRIIRVPSFAEYAGEDEATRTAARWGETEGYDAPPPASEGGARALVVVIDHGARKPDMTCSGDALVQTCTVAAHAWDGVTLQWWRTLAKNRLERFRDRALRQCFDRGRSWTSSGRCNPDPSSNEPAYLWRP